METIAEDLRVMQRTPLHDEHVEILRKAGEVKTYKAGNYIAEAGDAMDHFIYVEDGEVEVVDSHTGERYLPHTLGPTQFLGEIAFLNGGAFTLPMRAAQDTRVIAVPREKMLDLMGKTPEMSDIILTVYTARRRRQIEDQDSSLKLIGADRDADVQRIAAFARRNRIPYHSVDENSEEEAETAKACDLANHEPAVIFGKDRVIKDPTPRKVARVLGLDLDFAGDDLLDLLIVGGGPAGVAAGVYAGSEGLRALVIEDVSIGGQAGTSSRIENYMGFPTGISGADLVWRGQVQAMKFGTRFAMPRRVSALNKCDDGTFCAVLEDGQAVCARAILVATGVQYRRLPLDRLRDFEGAGVYYAATDMEARFCRRTDAVIIGGGNSAGQAAMFLSRAANHVHLLVRGDSLAESMSDYLRDRLEADERITIHYGCEVNALHGDDRLEAVTICEGDDKRRVDTSALFIMVGAAPNTGWLSNLVDLDPRGFVKTGNDAGTHHPFATSTPGIYAVGDVRAGSIKRVAAAVGEGSVVVSIMWKYLDALEEAKR